MATFRWTALAILMQVLPIAVRAQDSPPPAASTGPREPSLRCWRGQPEPACRTFVITELAFYARVVTSKVETGLTYPGGGSDTVREDAFGDLGTFELGVMRNRGPRAAIGATAVFGVDANGARFGAKGRYRRWLTPEGLALDYGAGVSGGRLARGMTTAIISGDVALNLRDYIAVAARADVAPFSRPRGSAVYLGGRVGSKPGLIATGLTVAGFFAIVLSFAGAWTE